MPEPRTPSQPPKTGYPYSLSLAAASLLAVLCIWSMWRTAHLSEQPVQIKHHYQPRHVMGTLCQLIVIAPQNQPEKVRQAFMRTEHHLRQLELLLSRHIDQSWLNRLNHAPAGQPVQMPPPILHVMRAAETYHRQTDGAFDATCMPLIMQWIRAGKLNQPPDPIELTTARRDSKWSHFRIGPKTVTKTTDTACVDLGGIAKGFAIDQAVEQLQQAGIQNGLVNIGGDMRCFGSENNAANTATRPAGWRVAVRSPFENRPWAELQLPDGFAVCTSGNYARFATIAGKRYSHIIDPRTGYPAEAAPTVTVIAHNAMTADAWATALSVLGPAGLPLLQNHPDIHAMIVTGTPEQYQVTVTPTFNAFVNEAEFRIETITTAPTTRNSTR